MNIREYAKENITFIEVSNDVGLTVILSNLGASIFHIKYEDIFLTRNALSVKDFKRPDCYYGKTIGRVANRIKGNKFKLNDTIYELEANEGSNTLHGGVQGLSNRIYDYNVNLGWDNITVTFYTTSIDGESGFPGNVNIEIKYVIYTKKLTFDVQFHAISDKDTVLSLTNHPYFTLGGDFRDLSLRISSDRFLDVRDDLIAKDIKLCEGVMDFRKAKSIYIDVDCGYLLRDRLKGFDHFFYFNKRDININNVTLENDKFALDFYSDFEGVQIYTSNHKTDYDLFPKCDNVRDAVAIEPSDNHLYLHLLKANQKYERKIIYNLRRK